MRCVRLPARAGVLLMRLNVLVVALVLTLGLVVPAHRSARAQEPAPGTSVESTAATTDSTAASEVSTDAMATSTDAADPSALTTDASMPGSESTTDSVASEDATTDTTSDRPRGEAATFRLTFVPEAGQTRRLTESNSEQMKLILPAAVEGAAPEERSRLTTTAVVSDITFEPAGDTGFKQVEVVQQYHRFEEGLQMPDPLEAALKGAKLVTQLDPNGSFMGIEDAAGFLAGLVSRAPEADRPALSAAIAPQAIEREAREGWQRKIGRYLTVPLRIGHASFVVEYEDFGEAGKLPFVVCMLPSTIESVNGRRCVRVDLVSFAATLKDGVVQGVPDEIDAEFMQWCEGKDIPFSPAELSVWGAGEVLLELNGIGTVHYRSEENFHLAPARINRPMGGPVDADELAIKRVDKLDVE